MIVLLNHESSITLYNYVSVSVLSGTVSICGSEIKAYSPPVKVFSSEKTGLIDVKTERFENIWANKDSLEKLYHEVTEVTGSKKQAYKILKKYTDTSVLIVVEHIILPHNLQFLGLYYPDILKFKLERKRGHYSISDSEDSFKFDNSVAMLANRIISAIRAASKFNFFI